MSGFDVMNGKTPISALQELMAAKKQSLPTYFEEDACGQFKCTVYAGGVTAVGFSSTKKGAKHESAKNALIKLQALQPPNIIIVNEQESKKNYVGDLNEYSSKNNVSYPIYNLIPPTSGTQYIYTCQFMGKHVMGISGNKKDAKQDTAKNMLKLIYADNNSVKKYTVIQTTTVEAVDENILALYDTLSFNSQFQQPQKSTDLKAVPEIKIVDDDSVKILNAQLKQRGIDYTITELKTNPYVLSLAIKDTNYTFVESGDTREDTLRKVLEKVLLVESSGCSLTADLIKL